MQDSTVWKRQLRVASCESGVRVGYNARAMHRLIVVVLLLVPAVSAQPQAAPAAKPRVAVASAEARVARYLDSIRSQPLLLRGSGRMALGRAPDEADVVIAEFELR